MGTVPKADVPEVHVIELLPGDGCRLQEFLGRSRRLGFPMPWEVAREVEHGFAAEACDEVHKFGDFRGRVVPPRYQQVGHLDVTGLGRGPDGVEHRVQIALHVVTVELGPDGLQVDVHRRDQRQQLGQWLRIEHPVRHQHIPDSCPLHQLARIHQVFEPDEGLIVGEGDGRRAVALRQREQFVRFDVPRRHYLLRDICVLAERTTEIAAIGSDRQDSASGQEMVERLLLNRVNGN